MTTAWLRGGEMKKTGLKDRNGQDIYENEIILVGMRRGDKAGWSEERVINLRTGWRKYFLKPVWALTNQRDEIMDMQNDQELRQKLSDL